MRHRSTCRQVGRRIPVIDASSCVIAEDLRVVLGVSVDIASNTDVYAKATHNTMAYGASCSGLVVDVQIPGTHAAKFLRKKLKIVLLHLLDIIMVTNWLQCQQNYKIGTYIVQMLFFIRKKRFCPV